jgi:hypothetical protein
MVGMQITQERLSAKGAKKDKKEPWADICSMQYLHLRHPWRSQRRMLELDH